MSLVGLSKESHPSNPISTSNGKTQSGDGVATSSINQASSSSSSSPPSPTSDTDLNLKPIALASQSHSLLDPTLNADFDPDAFLVSRAPGTDLTSISKELNEYSQLLSTELVDVINDDYRPFIQLGR